MPHQFIHLDQAAYEALREFMLSRPDIWFHEVHEEGIDPLRYPDTYMAAELHEPQHAEVLQRVLENRFVLDLPIMRQWIVEELYEPEHENDNIAG